jgi:hypothetical protein
MTRKLKIGKIKSREVFGARKKGTFQRYYTYRVMQSFILFKGLVKISNALICLELSKKGGSRGQNAFEMKLYHFFQKCKVTRGKNEFTKQQSRRTQ